METFDDTSWDLIDYSALLNDVARTSHLYWGDHCAVAQVNALGSDLAPLDYDNAEKSAESLMCVPLAAPALLSNECADKECIKKRGRTDSCSRVESKACRERLRRERLNEKFLELSLTLEPGRPPTTDKLAILGDAIRALNQLKTESRKSKEIHDKLLEEIKTLKAEKNELREEKFVLKADKAKLEQQLEGMKVVSSTGFMTPHSVAYQAGSNKVPVFPGYGYVPMWQYLPHSARDTSQDHELRPPAA